MNELEALKACIDGGKKIRHIEWKPFQYVYFDHKEVEIMNWAGQKYIPSQSARELLYRDFMGYALTVSDICDYSDCWEIFNEHLLESK